MVAVEQLPFGVRLENALVSYAGYLGKTVWPSNLSIFYPHPGALIPLWHLPASAAVLLILTGITFLLGRRQPALIVGWLWFLGTLVPVIGLVQVGTQAMADRYAYVPLIGIFIGLAWAVPASLLHRPLVRIGMATAAGLLLAAYAADTWAQLGHWRDDRAVWQHALEVDPDNPVAHQNWGVTLYRLGKVDEAEEEFARALGLSPKFTVALNGLGTCLLRRGEVDKAITLFQRAININPRQARAHSNLGLAYFEQGKMAAAANEFQEARQLAPEVAEYHYNAGTALAELKDKGAVQAYEEGHTLDPEWPQHAHRLAKELLAAENPRIRSPAEALFCAKQASQATGGKDPEIVATLARAYAVTGRLAEALEVAKRARELAAGAGQAELDEQIQKDLRIYEETLKKKKTTPLPDEKKSEK